jgi:hypothetical protein
LLSSIITIICFIHPNLKYNFALSFRTDVSFRLKSLQTIYRPAFAGDKRISPALAKKNRGESHNRRENFRTENGLLFYNFLLIPELLTPDD